MKILDWLKSRNSTIGEASGDRVNEAIANKERLDLGMAPQRKALFLDTDGTKSYHYLSMPPSGRPEEEIKIGVFNEGKMPDRKVYNYESDVDGFMVYRQV